MTHKPLMYPAAVLAAAAAVALAVTAAAQERVRLEPGEFEYMATTTGVLVAAPHGTFDINTDALAIAVARKLGSGYIVFRGDTPAGARINANRPTEGAGRACANEDRTERARIVYETYVRLMHTASGGTSLAWYVELHGNADPRTANRIDVASKGISATDAAEIKRRYPAILEAVRRESPPFPALELWVEPADRILFTASCTKTLGVLSVDAFARALHFEFPRSARHPDLLNAAASLTAALLQGLPGRR